MIKNDGLTIYLCGQMTGLTYAEMTSWRYLLKDGLEKCSDMVNCRIKVILPTDYYSFTEPRHQSELEVMNYDLSLVRNSDIVIANTTGLNKSVGSIIEVYEAWKSGIPVIAYDEIFESKKMHPWLTCCFTRIESSANEICEYIKDFYMQ